MALVTYAYSHIVVPVAFLRWSDIRNLGYQLAGKCVDDNRQSGAGEIFSMSIFLFCLPITLLARYLKHEVANT